MHCLLLRHGIAEEPHTYCVALDAHSAKRWNFKNKFTIPLNIEITPELVCDQSPMLLFFLLQSLPPEAVVMCVSHEPHLGQTAALMLMSQHSPNLSFKKADSSLFAFHKNAIIGKGILEWWIPPAQL